MPRALLLAARTLNAGFHRYGARRRYSGSFLARPTCLADTTALPTLTRGKSCTMPPASREVQLTELERDLFATLLAAVKHTEMKVTLRCAGGWVRDKLLGKESDDIDVALDTMLGREFAEKVNEYLESTDKTKAKVAVIQANPEQSKHLETARMQIGETWIDCVNLRSETYASDSRVPEMEFGTPKEDAYRRDFTVNSMFYNITEGVVEDFTERGLQDLDEGVIRTPLAPMETFLDDPLRVLRAVRFGARFSFYLEESLQQAASNQQVLDALQKKVSRERVGTELEGMFKCADPVGAIRHLVNLSVFPVVFSLPGSTSEGADGRNCLTVLEEGWKILEAKKSEVNLSDVERRLFVLATLLLPFRMETYKQKKKKLPVTNHIIRESLKWKVKDCENVEKLHKTVPKILNIMGVLKDVGLTPDGGSNPSPDTNIRVALGLWVRELKELWRVGALMAPLLAMSEAEPFSVEPSDSRTEIPPSLKNMVEGPNVWENRLAFFDDLKTTVHGFNLQEAWAIKPLLGGKEVMSVLEMEKGGPQLGKAMEHGMNWQLANPEGTKEQLAEYLKKGITE
ncbi:hypothetical protein BSKO_05813 [Bryopsis sp. KO-2023]|nr:hypothetical protein BSKO_05813 [Bryopsis sp. KO-2023]